MIYYMGAIGLAAVGLYTVSTKHNLIKIVLGLGIIDSGVNLFLVSLGYVQDGTAPIFSSSELKPESMVDPVPQALVLTAIVIGVAVLALALSMVIQVYHHYGTLDARKIRDLKW